MVHADQAAAVAAVAKVMERNGMSSPMHQATPLEKGVSESHEAVRVFVLSMKVSSHCIHACLW
jgi:hypothetical protein